MSILKLIFGKSDVAPPDASEHLPVACERIEQRRCNAHRAYHEEHLFGYVDSDGNLSATPLEPRS